MSEETVQELASRLERQTMTEKLKPCPFCGSEMAPTLIDRGVYRDVHCSTILGGCDAIGPLKSDDDDAIAAWNKRADQAAEIKCLTAERDTAVASAILAERIAIAAQLREWADELGFENSWRWKTPGGLLYRAAEMVSDRSKP